MAVKDGLPSTDFSRMNREWVKKVAEESGGAGLPHVTEADNGKILGVVNGAWGAMDAGGGGSSDFSTAEVTVTNNYESEIEIGDFVALPPEDLPINLPLNVGFAVPASETKTVYAVLYKNAAFTCSISNYVNDMIITVTGDIEDDGDGYLVVSGGGTITISKQL